MIMNPYTRLKQRVHEFLSELRSISNSEQVMFNYLDADLKNGSFSLQDLYQRTLAAHTLDYEVVLRPTDKGMSAVYRRRFKLPWFFASW